ncbi:AAA family ATPase [Frigidibacter sp. MR17.24]|uniref:AAA family ATPase n=1 Tax=Frigidibacter sp. MR17.24 TaxID=3127345 RepID=UPI0030130101
MNSTERPSQQYNLDAEALAMLGIDAEPQAAATDFADLLGESVSASVIPFPTGNLGVALKLAAAGKPVFPCREAAETIDGKLYDEKSPAIPKGFKGATTDAAQIRAWWKSRPNALVGLPTGRASGLAVLDCDRHKPGEDGIEALSGLSHEPNDLTPAQVQTAGNGLHLYFAWSEGLTNSASHLPRGLDIRGEGGYVIAPGSRFPDGRGYGAADLAGPLPSFPAALRPIGGPSSEGAGVKPREGATVQRIRDCMSRLVNDMDREEWFKIIAALSHEARAPDAEGKARPHAEVLEICEIAADWTASHPDYAGDAHRRDTEKTFWTCRHERRETQTTFATIRHSVGEPHFEVELEFEDMGDEEDEFEDLLGSISAAHLFAPASRWAGKPVPKREWLVPGLIPNGVVTMLSGDGGTGKSLLSLQLAAAVASGGKWIGQTVERPGKALFLSAEDDEGELHRRLSDICGGDLSGLENLLVKSTVEEDPLLATFDRTNKIAMTALFERVSKAVAQERPSLLVLDTLANLHSGDENNKAHALQFVNKLKGIASKHRCAVLLLAHPSMSGMANGSGAAGSVGWGNTVRSRLYLSHVIEKDREGETRRPDPDARQLTTTKSNYGATGSTIDLRWQAGKFVAPAEEVDDFGEVETREEKAERVFLKILDRKAGDFVSPNRSNKFAPKLFALEPDAERCGKHDLEAAMRRLLYRKAIEVKTRNNKGTESQYLRITDAGDAP